MRKSTQRDATAHHPLGAGPAGFSQNGPEWLGGREFSLVFSQLALWASSSNGERDKLSLEASSVLQALMVE